MPIFRKSEQSALFVHIPKTGGTSIEGVFRNSGYEIDLLDGRMGAGSLNRHRRCTPQHMHAEMLQHILRVERFDFVFMLVRDPIARFKSEYIWRNRKDPILDPAHIESWAASTFTKYASNPYIFDNHLRPQTDFYIPGATVYHFEAGMENIIDDVSQRLELRREGSVPHAKSGAHRAGVSSRDVILTERTFQRVTDFYRDDALRFGY